MAVKKTSDKDTVTLKRTGNRSRKSTASKELNLEEHRDSIEKLAYDIWEQRGRNPGDGVAEWLEAERIVKEKFSVN